MRLFYTCYEIRGIGTKGTIPDPPLMSLEDLFLLELVIRRY